MYVLPLAAVAALSTETQFGLAPGGKFLEELLGSVGTPLVLWFGRHILRIATLQGETFGGDAEFGYVTILCFVCASASVALVWTVVDRRQGRDALLHRGLRVAARYALAFHLFLYGLDKVVPNAQFPFPPLQRLLMPIGNLSRYTLFWSSMGTSPFYAAFAGVVEVVAGLILLLVPQAILGPLLATAAMANVVVLNIGFDIPVKNFSIHLLLLAVFLLVPDLRRIIRFLVLNRSAEGRVNPALGRGVGWFRVARLSLKSVMILYMFATSLQSCLRVQHMLLERSPLYGIYDVAEFTSTGTSKAGQWKRVIFGIPGYITIQQADDTMQRLTADYDPGKGALTISSKGEKSVLTCSRPDADHLVLEGQFLKQTVRATFAKVDESKYVLTQSHIRWIAQ
jgi:hypothetical protein